MTTVMTGELAGAQHLAHMSGVTREWLSQLDRGAAAPLPVLYDDTREDPPPAVEVLREVWAAALKTATTADGTGHLPHPSAAQFLTHTLIHDAHHRGQVLLALKGSGFPLPNENAMWGPLRDE